jgi:flagellar basal body-associated protein FliL
MFRKDLRRETQQRAAERAISGLTEFVLLIVLVVVICVVLLTPIAWFVTVYLWEVAAVFRH